MGYNVGKSAIVARWAILSFAVVLPVLRGCTRYQIGVTTYLSHDLPFPPVDPSTRIAIVTESDPDEPLLEAEVKRKIEALVRGRGFEVADRDDASHILAAFFAIDAGNTGSGVASVYQPGGTSRSFVYTNTGRWATATTHHPGTTSYVPYSYTYFTRFLGVSLYERERWLASEDDDLADAIVWRATTTSAGSSSDLRRVVDYLLVTTFEHFGEDTGKRKRETLFQGDRRVRDLREEASGTRSKKP